MPPHAPREPHPATAKALLDSLAERPRGAGTEGERAARAQCIERLERAGFATREVPFTYSAFPGRWATPVAGVAVLLVTGVAGHLGFAGAPAAGLGALAGGLVTIGLFAWWSGVRGVLSAPVMRRDAHNLLAMRPGTPRPPDVWLIAHLDSKSQPVPIGLRAGAIMLASLACLALVVLGLAALAGQPWAATGQDAWRVATVVAWLAALPIVASTVGNRSAGALDNASGVVSVLLAAEALPTDAPVGVLLTSAEELGLAGARAWVASVAPRTGIALNCDGVDDAGSLTVMRARGGDAAARAMADGARDIGAPLRIRRLIPGVLVDAVAFADAGWTAATLSRGTARTLLRIHTRADSADRLDGRGMAEAARVLARAATALTAPQAGSPRRA